MENITRIKYSKEDINELFKDDLKSHYLKRENNTFSVPIESINKFEDKNSNLDNTQNKNNSKLIKLKTKILIKIAICLVISICILIYKKIPSDNLKNNFLILKIKEEYNKNYTIEYLLEEVEEISKKAYLVFEEIVPESLYNFTVFNYLNNIKPKIINFNLNKFIARNEINNTVAVFNPVDVNINNDMVPAEEAITTSSTVSLMDMDKKEILSKNINIIQPVYGTITSEYGARDEVFKNVGYHTGIDIANVMNTQIKSATDGVVVLAQSMDKYYGNNIEIENNGVRFKYAHLNQINVKVGDNIKQGDIIGLMGSTGMSTGSHLHFEIIINNRTVDPRMIIKIN